MSDSQSVNVADPVVSAMITFCLRFPPLTITGVSRWLTFTFTVTFSYSEQESRSSSVISLLPIVSKSLMLYLVGDSSIWVEFLTITSSLSNRIFLDLAVLQFDRKAFVKKGLQFNLLRFVKPYHSNALITISKFSFKVFGGLERR